MTAWADLGLPCPLRAEYGWLIDAGLSRTPFAGPLPEQVAVRSSRRQTFSLAWQLTAAELARAEPYLLASAYAGEGIVLDLLTSSGYGPVTVRLAADLEIKATRGDLFQVSARFETLQATERLSDMSCDDLADLPPPECDTPVEISQYLATSPYPLLSADTLAATARLVGGNLSPYVQDAYQSRHDFTAGALIQTRQFVLVTQPPDAVVSTHRFTYGEIVVNKTLVPAATADATTAAHIFTAGEIVTVGVVTIANPEVITASARLTGGTLE